MAAGEVTGSDQPETVLKLRVTKDGKLIGTDNDGTVKKAGVGIYDITFNTGPTGSKVPRDVADCATRLLPFGENKITPFLTNVSFDVAAIC